jgi:hypothetical protein
MLPCFFNFQEKKWGSYLQVSKIIGCEWIFNRESTKHSREGFAIEQKQKCNIKYWVQKS